MNSEAFQTYKHSGKFGIHGPILALLAAVALGFPLGIAYAHLVRWIPFIYINFFATLGYGALFGVITSLLLKVAKVRNNTVAVLTGLLVGLIALYFAWSGYLFAIIKDGPWFWWPDQIFRAMQLLYQEGSWSLRSGGPVTGPLLALIWLVEAGIIVGMATAIGAAIVSTTPFCEVNQCWLDQKKDIDTLELFTDLDQRAAFKAGDLAPLAKAKPKTPGAPTFTRLTLKSSPKCDIFYTVCVQDVTLTRDKKGNLKTNVKPITKDLMLPPSMFELIAKFENFKAAETSTEPAPPSAPAPEAT
jgi:hypothetical protein